MADEAQANIIEEGIQQDATQSQFSVAQIPYHTHNGTDSPLITDVNLASGHPIKLGLGGMGSTISVKGNIGTTAEQIQTSIASGRDQEGTFGVAGGNLQFNLLHQPNNTLNQSFITAFRPPLFGTVPGTTISVTAGGNTVTTPQTGFVVNSLAGALINIFSSAGAFIESQVINSNTATLITINGTWLYTTNLGSYFIYQPVFFGAADTIYQRLYTQEGTGGGLRIGPGPTNGVGGTPPSQNGLLYMNPAGTGTLTWRDKTGAAIPLTGGGGSVTSFAFTNTGFHGTVANPTTTPTLSITYAVNNAIIHSDGTGDAQFTSIPNDATKFLNGDTTPAYAQVKDSDLSLSNITTNDVSITKHGFAPIAPNDTGKFLRGDATWSALPAGNVTYKNGVTTKNSADASTTQNIAHGLGATPSNVKITAQYTAGGANQNNTSFTIYNGTTQSSTSVYGVSNNMILSSNFVIGGGNGSAGSQTGVVTFDATNIIITWTLSGAQSGTYNLLWEALL